MMIKAKIINCHQLSIRRDIDDPNTLNDTIATYNAGDIINVENDTVHYSWKDREYYKVKLGMRKEEGYALKDCLELI